MHCFWHWLQNINCQWNLLLGFASNVPYSWSISIKIYADCKTFHSLTFGYFENIRKLTRKWKLASDSMNVLTLAPMLPLIITVDQIVFGGGGASYCRGTLLAWSSLPLPIWFWRQAWGPCGTLQMLPIDRNVIKFCHFQMHLLKSARHIFRCLLR